MAAHTPQREGLPVRHLDLGGTQRNVDLTETLRQPTPIRLSPSAVAGLDQLMDALLRAQPAAVRQQFRRQPDLLDRYCVPAPPRPPRR